MARQRSSKTPRKNETRVAADQPNRLLTWLLIPFIVAVGLSWHYSLPNTLGSFLFSTKPELQDGRAIHERNTFHVIDIPGKGKGTVAVRNIKQGDLIIRDSPLILMPSQMQPDYLLNLLESFSNETLSLFFGLSRAPLSPDVNTDPATQTESDIQEEAMAIMDANGVVLTKNLVGLFPKYAMINHACAGSFNVEYSWREDQEGSGELFVHALKDIKRGEEITTMYMDTRQPMIDRQAYLLQEYGFECTCPTCSLPDPESAASDLRLTAMKTFLTNFTSWIEGDISGRQAADFARQIWRLSEEEQYFHGRGKLCDDMTFVAAAHSDKKALHEWAKLALQWYTIEMGSDSLPSRRMKKVLHNPTSHPEWGKSPREAVGGPFLE